MHLYLGITGAGFTNERSFYLFHRLRLNLASHIALARLTPMHFNARRKREIKEDIERKKSEEKSPKQQK